MESGRSDRAPIIAALIGPDKAYTLGYTVIGTIALVALVLPLVTKMPRPKADALKVMTLDASGVPLATS